MKTKNYERYVWHYRRKQMISGKEALEAIMNGECVEAMNNSTKLPWSNAKQLNLYCFESDTFQFRLKPRTITINGVEVEAPKEIVNDPVTGAVGLVYGDNQKSKEAMDVLRSIFK